jgi:ABC-2 type transport system permease protein
MKPFAGLSFLLEKEFLQILRNRQIMAMILILPVLQLVVLANAATFELEDAPFVVVDHDRSPASRDLVRHFVASERFRLVGMAETAVAAEAALRRGEAIMSLELPRGFGRDLERERRASALLVFDAVDGASAGIASAYASAILRRFEADIAAAAAARGGDPPPPAIRREVSYWFNPGLSYRDYMVPGIVVELVTMVGLLLSALNIVREKEIGTLEQLSVTPMARSTFIAAKLIPFWVLGLVALTVGLTVARVLFDVPMRGSVPLVFVLAAVYLLVMVGVGLAISTVSHNQQQATFLALFVLIVFILLSGLFTPASSMPQWAQRLTQLNPLYHFVAIMRQVLLMGTPFAGIRYHAGALAVLAVVVLPVATLQFRKRGG